MKALLSNLSAIAVIVTGMTGLSSAQEDLSGVWQQKLLMPTGKWKDAGTFEVRKDSNGKLTMVTKKQPKSHDLIASKGITNVDKVADVWTFDSDWGNGQIGNFVLKADDQGRYVGYSYLNGQKRSLNLWVRVSKEASVPRNADPVHDLPDINVEARLNTAPSKQKSIKELVSGTTWRSDYSYNNRKNKDTTEIKFHADGTLTGSARIQAGRYIDFQTVIDGNWQVKGRSILIRATEISTNATGGYNKLLLVNDDQTELTISTERLRSPFKKMDK